MALSEGKAKHVTGRYYPRSVGTAFPLVAGQAFFPRDQEGVTVLATMPDPLGYWAIDADVTTNWADEAGWCDLNDIRDMASDTGKEGTCADISSVGSPMAFTTSQPTTLVLARLVVSAWVKHSGLGTINHWGYADDGATGQWSVSLKTPAPGDGLWHHVLIWFPAAAPGTKARVCVDGGPSAEHATSTVTIASANRPYVSGNDANWLDELAWFYLAAEPTEAAAENYAAVLYNGGTGIFWRSAGGWYQP